MGYSITKGSKLEGTSAVGGFRPLSGNFKKLSDGSFEVIDFNINNVIV